MKMIPGLSNMISQFRIHCSVKSSHISSACRIFLVAPTQTSFNARKFTASVGNDGQSCIKQQEIISPSPRNTGSSFHIEARPLDKGTPRNMVYNFNNGASGAIVLSSSANLLLAGICSSTLSSGFTTIFSLSDRRIGSNLKNLH